MDIAISCMVATGDDLKSCRNSGSPYFTPTPDSGDTNPTRIDKHFIFASCTVEHRTLYSHQMAAAVCASFLFISANRILTTGAAVTCAHPKTKASLVHPMLARECDEKRAALEHFETERTAPVLCRRHWAHECATEASSHS